MLAREIQRKGLGSDREVRKWNCHVSLNPALSHHPHSLIHSVTRSLQGRQMPWALSACSWPAAGPQVCLKYTESRDFQALGISWGAHATLGTGPRGSLALLRTNDVTQMRGLVGPGGRRRTARYRQSPFMWGSWGPRTVRK